AGGVVLRGSGDGDNGTTLIAAGTSRRTLIEIGGRGGRSELTASRAEISADLVPIGARRIPVADAKGFAPGNRVIVRRPCTAEWIAELGMNTMPGWRTENRIQWATRSRELAWDRTVTTIEGDALV